VRMGGIAVGKRRKKTCVKCEKEDVEKCERCDPEY
jgi:anaerobic ribonucleoside-triphosphate reductase